MAEKTMNHNEQEEMVPAVGEGGRESAKAFDPETATREDWEALLARKDQEIAELKDKMLRLAADMENTRKRLERERSEAICFANENILRELLSVVDNLERAIQHGESESDPERLLEGIRMTHKNFLDILAKFGCTPFESRGKSFDPNFHEAILQQESRDHPPNSVIAEYQKGYLLNERLLRPALVVVSRAQDDSGRDAPAGSEPNATAPQTGE